jgi:8-oxo-dGTP pyrophosphatase MutT (NUDIX family)
MEIAVAVLVTPEGEVALQRRREDSKVYAGMLSLFGGHVNKREGQVTAINRELEEELSVTPAQTRLMTLMRKKFAPVAEYERPIKVFVFHGRFPEGCTLAETDGAIEFYPLEEALQQPDLVPTARAGLQRYASSNIGSDNGIINY